MGTHVRVGGRLERVVGQSLADETRSGSKAVGARVALAAHCACDHG